VENSNPLRQPFLQQATGFDARNTGRAFRNRVGYLSRVTRRRIEQNQNLPIVVLESVF
jgi:hypothetical protein